MVFKLQTISIGQNYPEIGRSLNLGVKIDKYDPCSHKMKDKSQNQISKFYHFNVVQILSFKMTYFRVATSFGV